ncbi:MAG: TlpA family protein disulfide reductase [Rhodobacteraceae bacterium]|nr:TlpA family protein disulfide reductase [Paracoccaceae bacterium]
MNRRFLLAAALASLATPLAARPAMPLHDAPRRIPSPPFSDGEGRKLTLDNFRGKVVLLNIWATWCIPCREEMPTLDRLQGQLGGDDFHVVALSIDRAGLPAIRKFYQEIGIQNLTIYLAEDIRVQFALAVQGLPTTLLIGRDGDELGRLVGPAEWDSRKMISLFETVIAEERNP